MTIALIAIPLILQSKLDFWISASHFGELAVAPILFGLASDTLLAVVVDVLVHVQVMLLLPPSRSATQVCSPIEAV